VSEPVNNSGNDNDKLRQTRKQLLSLKLNSQRLTRALSLLSVKQQDLLQIIPWLFQTSNSLPLDTSINQEQSSQAPSGIANFELTQTVANAAQVLGLPSVSSAQDTRPAEYALEGVYIMGSTGTLGQNPTSDIDVWLVHRASLASSALKLLKEKAARLTLWFANYNFEVNFYFVHPHQFRENLGYEPNQGRLSQDNSGSTQQWLLLEEFYRTHIVLAGKPIAWWPSANADTVTHQQNTATSQWLFLGDVQTLPATEYFGASLWQLYKGLNMPHKALLKVLLLEVYAASYPHSQLISSQIWQSCEQDDLSPSNDSYYILYQRIEAYLLSRGEVERLEIIRRCFYLKCGLKLTKDTSSLDWRHELIQAQVKDWQWSTALLTHLDNCQHWDAGQLLAFNLSLNELLLTSYRNLLAFAAKQALSDTVRVEELGILARKLHTYFSEDEHQLLPVNLLWSENIAEQILIVRYKESDKRYHLYSRASQEASLFKADNVTALVAWARFNGIASDDTQWVQDNEANKLPQDVNFRHSNLGQLRNTQLATLSQGLAGLMGQPLKVSKLHLCQPWYYQRLILVANLDGDSVELWLGDKTNLESIDRDIFSFGDGQRNLLSSLDVICLNSWGEWQSHRFEGNTGLLEALSFISLGLKRAPKALNTSVLSCSPRLKWPMEAALTHLVDRCVTLYRQSSPTASLMLSIMLAKHRYGLFFSPDGIMYTLLEADKDYCQRCDSSCIEVQCQEPIKIAAPELGQIHHISVPSVIEPYITKGAKQYFLRLSSAPSQTQGAEPVQEMVPEPRIEVFMVDEHNHLTQMSLVDQTMEQFVAQKSHAFAFESNSSTASYFNMPQFFKLLSSEGTVDVVPFGVHSQDLGAEF
jgi:adenylate cyclase class 1